MVKVGLLCGSYWCKKVAEAEKYLMARKVFWVSGEEAVGHLEYSSNSYVSFGRYVKWKYLLAWRLFFLGFVIYISCGNWKLSIENGKRQIFKFL